MAKLKPWYNVVTPWEDLCKEKPLDASEFAVNLDQVRNGRANEDFQNPVRGSNIHQTAGLVHLRVFKLKSFP